MQPIKGPSHCSDAGTAGDRGLGVRSVGGNRILKALMLQTPETAAASAFAAPAMS